MTNAEKAHEMAFEALKTVGAGHEAKMLCLTSAGVLATIAVADELRRIADRLDAWDNGRNSLSAETLSHSL